MCHGNSHHLLKCIFGICLCSMLTALCQTSQICSKMVNFLCSAYFGGHFCYHSQAFKRALLFLFFLLFPTFLICSYFSLPFHENTLLSLLFHPKMSFLRKKSRKFPWLASLEFYTFTVMFIQGTDASLNTSNFNF